MPSRCARAFRAAASGSISGAPSESDERTRRGSRDVMRELARGRTGSVPSVMGPIVSEPRPDDGVVIDRLTLAPESRNEGSEHAVPVAVVQPHGDWDDALPVVAFLHGTGGDTEGLMPSLVAIAARGYVAVGVDAPCHGRRLDPGSAAPSRRGRRRAGSPSVEVPVAGCRRRRAGARLRELARAHVRAVRRRARRRVAARETSRGENGTGSGGNEGESRGDAPAVCLTARGTRSSASVRDARRRVQRSDRVPPGSGSGTLSVGGVYAVAGGRGGPRGWSPARSPPSSCVPALCVGFAERFLEGEGGFAPARAVRRRGRGARGDPSMVDTGIVGRCAAGYARVSSTSWTAGDSTVRSRPRLLVVSRRLDPRCPFPGLMNAVTETRAACLSRR